MRFRAGRDFFVEQCPALLTHTKPPATWAGKHINRQMRAQPARKASSSISEELTLPVVLPHEIKHTIQGIKRSTRIHVYGNGGGKQVLFSIVLNQIEPATLSRRNMMKQSCTTAGTQEAVILVTCHRLCCASQGHNRFL